MKFLVWPDFDGPNDMDPEDATEVDASSPTDAAVKFADHSVGTDLACVVRSPTGQYTAIELVQVWDADVYEPTTLEELRDPKRRAR